MSRFLVSLLSASLALTVPAMAMSQPQTVAQKSAPQASTSHPAPSGKPAPTAQPAPSKKSASSPQSSHNASHKTEYGEWSNSWGSRPPAPPAHYKNKGSWYRHVHNCQQRYKSYNPRTDSYRTYSGKSLTCKL